MFKTSNWISMSIFTALKRARLKIVEYPGLSFQEAANLCIKTSSDGTPHDYKTASDLHRALPAEIIDLDNPGEIRKALTFLILNFENDWVYFFPSGREAVRNALTRNEYQVFRNAELYLESPALEVVNWWDFIANKYRSQALDNSYREAELKSLNLERALLSSMNCPYEPVWVALNDNSLGFDIRSYRQQDDDWVPFAIEVKSTSGSRFRFYLTRNEVNLATRMASNYALHFWASGSVAPLTFQASQITRHLPRDNGSGKWDSVVIEAENSDDL